MLETIFSIILLSNILIQNFLFSITEILEITVVNKLMYFSFLSSSIPGLLISLTASFSKSSTILPQFFKYSSIYSFIYVSIYIAKGESGFV